MKKFQFIWFLCLLGCSSAKAQDTSFYEIRYITLDQALRDGDDENSVVKRKHTLPAPDEISETQIVRLDFVDKRNNKRVRSFDVYANSPFEKLEHRKIGVNYSGGSIYQVESLLPGDQELFLKKPIQNEHSMYDSIPPPPYEVYSIASVSEEGKSFVTISYRSYAIKRYNGFVGMEEAWGEDIATSLHCIKVLNRRGEVIHEYHNLALDDYIPVTTDNGKYIAVKYAECATMDCSSPVKQGLKFVRLEDGEVIDFAISLDERTRFSLLQISNLFFYRTELWRTPLIQDQKWRVFDLEKMVVYEKLIPHNEKGRLHARVLDGIEYKYLDRPGIYKYTFDKDFQKIKIQEP